MIKLVTIIGARPQIIKAAAISRAVKTSFSDKIKEVIVHTGQHYDHNMSAVFFDELKIPKENYNLNVGSASHAVQTAEIMRLFEPILEEEKPQGVLVYGDTNSTLAAALTAAKMHIPVFHVEAGMRSFNKTMPEEINRICCDHISTMLFSPTVTGIENLCREGFSTKAKAPYTINNPLVVHCGDVMYDNSIYFATEAKQKSTILSDLNLSSGEFTLCTIHRDSNTDDADNLNSIFRALLHIAGNHKQKIVIPMHPRTSKVLSQQLQSELAESLEHSSEIQIIEPVSFMDMIVLESECNMIITDSGGVQKESYFFKKPCVILRNETEWVELIEQGTAVIGGTETENIIAAFNRLKSKKLNFPPLFGDGHAAEFICKQIYSAMN